MEKQEIDKAGWINRKEVGLPSRLCLIDIIVKDVDGEYIHRCLWTPYDPETYEPQTKGAYRTGKVEEPNKPAEGYLGSARIVDGRPHAGIGFNAWEQNDYEFIYYKVI